MLDSRFADKFPDTTAEEVLAAEYLLSQGIRYSFDVRHPFRGLEGLIMDLKKDYPNEVLPAYPGEIDLC